MSQSKEDLYIEAGRSLTDNAKVYRTLAQALTRKEQAPAVHIFIVDKAKYKALEKTAAKAFLNKPQEWALLRYLESNPAKTL